jgi:hypothetical protein
VSDQSNENSSAVPAVIPLPLEDRIKELEAQNALFRIVLTNLFTEITMDGRIQQPTFELLRKMQSGAEAPTNAVYEKLKALKDVATAAEGVYDYLLGESVRRSRAISTLRKVLGRPLVATELANES